MKKGWLGVISLIAIVCIVAGVVIQSGQKSRNDPIVGEWMKKSVCSCNDKEDASNPKSIFYSKLSCKKDGHSIMKSVNGIQSGTWTKKGKGKYHLSMISKSGIRLEQDCIITSKNRITMPVTEKMTAYWIRSGTK